MAIETFESLSALEAWLVRCATDTGELSLVLAEFDHVVTFAKVGPEGVKWSPRAPSLHPVNLLELRLFGEAGEWRLSFDGQSGFEIRYLNESFLTADDYLEEPQVLWGRRVKELPGADGWCALEETGRGIRLEVPVPGIPGELAGGKALRLVVRHHIGFDEDTGLAEVTDSRLVRLEWDR